MKGCFLKTALHRFLPIGRKQGIYGSEELSPDTVEDIVETAVKIARLFTTTAGYLRRLEFLSWYELLDQQHSVFNRITCEGYFGVVKQDLEPKRVATC